MAWTSPEDVRAQVQRLWDRGEILRAGVTGAAMFPLELRTSRPGPRALADEFDAVRSWIRALESESKTARGHGYEIVWAETNHRQLGRNRVPAGVVVPTEDDALELIGKRRPAARFRQLVGATVESFPELSPWLAARPLRVLEHAEDWSRVLAVLSWFRAHPRPAIYLRQLDIPDVHTKFVETHRALLTEMLDLILPPEAIVADATGASAFERRYGLLPKPPQIRFRILDDRKLMNGMSDMAVPAVQFARLDPPVGTVFITENEINGLAFPQFPDAIVIFGLGYALDRLRDVDWLARRSVHYWGDVDTHGFAMLNRLRHQLPHARSLLMDRDTLLAHRELWVTEPDRQDAELNRLTPAEGAVFDDLRFDRLGFHIRLEQERVSYRHVRAALDSLSTG